MFNNPLNLPPVNQIKPRHSKEYISSLNTNTDDDNIFICVCGSKLINIKSCTLIVHLNTNKHNKYLWSLESLK